MRVLDEMLLQEQYFCCVWKAWTCWNDDVSIPWHRTIRVKRFQPRIRWLIWIPTPKWVIFVLKTNCLFVVTRTMARFNYSRDCCCDKAGAVKWASVCVCRKPEPINSGNGRKVLCQNRNIPKWMMTLVFSILNKLIRNWTFSVGRLINPQDGRNVKRQELANGSGGGRCEIHISLRLDPILR